MTKSLLKKLSFCVCLAALMGTACAFFGCSSNNNSSTDNGVEDSENKKDDEENKDGETGGDKATLYKFEAEYTYLNDVVGGGISGAASGLNMIQESSDASEGYYVGSTHSTSCVITYKITAEAACTATLRIIAANELSAMTISKNTLEIKVNGTEVSYTSFTVPKEVKQSGKTFKAYKIGDISLVAGENTITLQVANKDASNVYCNGGPGGLLYDYISLETTGKLTTVEYKDNVE